MDLVDAYKEIGILGFVLVGFAALAFHMAYILRLVLLKKINGAAADDDNNAPSCPWSPEKAEANYRLHSYVEEILAHQRAQQRMIDKGNFTCRWSSKQVNDLVTEMRLLRQALESVRGRIE